MKSNEITNHYAALKSILPVNYRQLIKEELKVSVSLIDKVLRGFAPDNKNIILCAYRIAKQNHEQTQKDKAELGLLKDLLTQKQ